MTHPDGYTMSALPQTRRDEVLELDQWAFASVSSDADLPLPLPWERTCGVGVSRPGPVGPQGDEEPSATTNQLVAMHSSYPFSSFPIPGAEVPAPDPKVHVPRTLAQLRTVEISTLPLRSPKANTPVRSWSHPGRDLIIQNRAHRPGLH